MRTKNPEYFTKIESFIDAYKEANGSSPSVREIEAGTGISKATVDRYLSYMREHDVLDYAGHRNIITKGFQKTSSETVRVPVLGTIACGLPMYAEENIEEYVRLPVSLFGRGEFYILRARGDSMIEADIDDGDLVLIRMQDTADIGQIVVALIEDETTLKRYYPEPKLSRIRLHPENSSMEDIYVDNCIIQGVAVKVLKDLI